MNSANNNPPRWAPHQRFTTDAGDELSVFPDRNGANEWRVEHFARDGSCYVTIFAGPVAEKRAVDYFYALKSGTIKLAHAG